MLARVRAQPWGAALLDALDGRCRSVHLVGGPVRDLLLGRDPVDVDLVVEGDAAAIARRLAERLGGSATEHERFGTATVDAAGLPPVNVVTARRERYARPGALPDVEPGTLEEDLARRDFTVNAIALGLDGRCAACRTALEDLDAGAASACCTTRASATTRRACCAPSATRRAWASRSSRRTEALARAAAGAGALGTVSGARIRDELLDLLREHGAPRSVALLRGPRAGRGAAPRGDGASSERGAWRSRRPTRAAT